MGIALIALGLPGRAESGLSRPVVQAAAKGPNQINLTWAETEDPGYGYAVEIQSPWDPRYPDWTELRPVPVATGYADDPGGAHVYNAAVSGVPWWVTEGQYRDPQDDLPAQYIVASLQPGAVYRFRVRSYRWTRIPEYSEYSAVAAAATLNYGRRYVSLAGSDASDGSAQAPWRTLKYASSKLACGEVLLVAGGRYLNDGVTLAQQCVPPISAVSGQLTAMVLIEGDILVPAAVSKAVVMAKPGEYVSVKAAPNAGQAIWLSGSGVVVDGLHVLESMEPAGDYSIVIGGGRNAVFNCETAGGWGIHAVQAERPLVYGCWAHDAGNVSNGEGGFTLTFEHTHDGAVWSNHLTRGAHDVSLCKNGCVHNRWLNNVMDGGWGMGFEAVDQSTGNLVEGNVIYDVGALMGRLYKPSIEVSSANTTARRNKIVGGVWAAFEISALYSGGPVSDSLVYGNTLVNVGSCLFGSQNDAGGLGDAAYQGVLWANNICRLRQVKTGVAVQMYRAVLSAQIRGNVFAGADGKQFIWGQTAPPGSGGDQYPVTLREAETRYAPAFADNTSAWPRFSAECEGDYSLHPVSDARLVGVPVVDRLWSAGWSLQSQVGVR